MKTLSSLILFLLITSLSFSQTLTGTVKSTEDQALENTNVMARAKDGKSGMKFAIADHLGRYRLELDKETNYTITVNYIGYEGVSLDYLYETPTSNYDFILTPKDELLDEIVIDYNYQPVIVKKDTLIYDVAAFMNGNERKLKDQLEKLPGVEVTDNGQVKVQGKTVTQFMVEGNSFFGGGTKLGVENIPADAVDKVEVIDHFTDVGHMKEVSGSDELAMNIKLKEDKKKFVFGDIRAGYGNNRFYESNASLFYYAAKINWSIIGNVNNFGSQLLSYDDIFRFEGFRSIYIKNNNQQQLINLYQYVNSNTDVVENKNQFIASDIRYAFGKKWDVKALFLFNKNWIRSQSDQNIQYLQSNDISFENRWNTSNNRSQLISGKLSADFRQNKNTTYNYNLQLAATGNNRNGTILSETDLTEKNLTTTAVIDNFALSQLFEFHKTINKKHKATLAFTHSYKKETPQYNWFSNESFLSTYIPWNPSEWYGLNELKSINQNNFQINAKHYWIAGRNHHIYTTLGYNGTYTNLSTSNNYLNDNQWNSLYDTGFGNRLNYRLNNPFAGIEYKYLYKKFTSTLGVFAHYYHLQNTYPTEKRDFSTAQIEPEVKLEYDFNKSESLRFNYSLNNNYLDAENYANRWQVSSFNALFKGNALLQNLQYQQASLRYSKFSSYSGFNTYASINYSKKNKNIRNQVEMVGIDQFYETVMSDQPDTNWNLAAMGSKRFKKIELRLDGSLGFNRYTQTINDIEIPSKRNYQTIGAGFKTLFKESPNINISYNKSLSQQKNSFENHSVTDRFLAKVETKFLNHFMLKADYNWIQTTFSEQKITIEQANAYLEFHKKDNPWTFMIKGNNLLNTGIKNNVSFSDFMIHNTNTYILPRVVLLSIQYKL